MIVLKQQKDLFATIHSLPVNIGSEEMISINDFAHLIADVAGKKIHIQNIDGQLVFVVVVHTML